MGRDKSQPIDLRMHAAKAIDGSLAEPPIFPSVAHWARAYWLRLTAISVMVLTLIFTGASPRETSESHPKHLAYRAYPAKANVWIARSPDESSNVLLECILSALSGIFGFPAAEQAAVSLASLICLSGAAFTSPLLSKIYSRRTLNPMQADSQF